MDDAVKVSIIFCIIMGLTISNIAWSISYYYTTTTIKAMQEGYIKQTLPGHDGTHWVLPDEEPDENEYIFNRH